MQKTLIIVLLVSVIALSGVIVYQKLTQPEPTPIVVNQPVVNEPVANQPNANTNCLKEGESRADDAGPNVPDKCCAGLVKVEPVDEFSPGAICKTAEGQPINEIAGQLTSYDPFRCTACGNGVCGKGENQCNCPADCKVSETAEWKTYTNDQYGFEIQYPAKAQEVQGKKVFGENVLFSLNLVPTQTKWNYLNLDIATDISSPNCYYSPLGQSILKEVREGFSDFCLNVEEDSGSGGAVSRDYYYTIMKNGKYLLLNFHVGYNKNCGLSPEFNCEKFDEAKDTKIFDQVLSTFKFTK